MLHCANHLQRRLRATPSHAPHKPNAVIKAPKCTDRVVEVAEWFRKAKVLCARAKELSVEQKLRIVDADLVYDIQYYPFDATLWTVTPLAEHHCLEVVLHNVVRDVWFPSPLAELLSALVLMCVPEVPAETLRLWTARWLM